MRAMADIVRTPGLRTVALLCLPAVLLALFSAACGSGEPNGPEASANDVQPSIALTSPAPAGSVQGSSKEVAVEIAGFVVDADAIGLAAVPGRGHWHVYLDGDFVNAIAVGTTTLEDIPSGPHHVRVSFANNDHSALSPTVEDSVVVDVLNESVVKPDYGTDYSNPY